MPIIRLENLLKSGTSADLDRIVRRARDLDGLAAELRRALPADMAENLVSANMREDGELVLVCRSSSWAARLRFESETILAAAKSAGVAATRCRVTVSQG